MHVTIIRDNHYDDSTPGRMLIDGHPDVKLYTLEEPWRDNRRKVSCIPAGEYTCVPHNWDISKKYKFSCVWRVEHVPNRDAILIHSGNTIKDIEGCILVGIQRGVVDGLRAVTGSRAAVDILRKIIGEKPFQLTIKNHQGGV